MVLVPLAFISCKKFLDKKPDQQLVIATTLADAEALLDNYSVFNSAHSALGDQSDDNFYLDDDRYSSLDFTSRNNYSWVTNSINDVDWSTLYQAVLNATTAMETIQAVERNSANARQWDQLKGAALFHRGFALLELVQYYAGIYDSTTATGQLGIPLRISSDVTVPSVRASLQQSWLHIVGSFKEAVSLLPVSEVVPSRPTRAAAWGALARTNLYMHRYTEAAEAADSCLALHDALIDFNTLDTSATAPFNRFNEEVIFPCTAVTAASLDIAMYTIDTLLYTAYNLNDLRRPVYFSDNGYGYSFKGTYDGDIYTGPFVGIATDEIMLIKAECLARQNNPMQAMQTLNSLLVTRWRSGTFIPYVATSAGEGLQIVLNERRKELIQRGTRWCDLRRLGFDATTAVTPVRMVENTLTNLPPLSSRYTFLIPQKVIDLTGMQQNVR